jgi:hypothetical protein
MQVLEPLMQQLKETLCDGFLDNFENLQYLF